MHRATLRSGLPGVTALVADLAGLDTRLVRLAAETQSDGAPAGAQLTRQAVSLDTLAALQHLATGVMLRPPDRVIRRRAGEKYLERWYLRRAPDGEKSDCAMFLHRIVQADEPPAHDHPWTSCSLLLAGTLVEQFADEEFAEFVELLVAEPGDVILRTAECMHMLAPISGPAITICATGARRRQWRFDRS